ncbi:coiled-coil domain-containing protein 81-like [Coturnix japonica]|uniref:coiled-coil domain-containing protein 81-like n=1 Tax=Coturnix japonica TaxID=93934 RepID=UPI000777A110|nr:coiled-coil domain-containing protein 81-like [Coturnix japonica]
MGCCVTWNPGAASERLQGGGCHILEELLADDWKHLEGVSSHMAAANKEQPARVMRTKLSWWEDGPATGCASRSPYGTTKERVAVWDSVAVCVQQQLLLHKGIRIPTFGSFDIVFKEIRAKEGTLVVQWPAFRLARNLLDVHSLTGDEELLTGHKEVEPLKYTEVASTASVSRHRVETCICSTTSLISHCLRNGENVAFVLKDIGVLFLEGARVQMKFYYDFLEKVCGKASLETAVFKVPWLLDMVVSRVAAVAP